jgi:excisionase family DNA binding protein
MATRIILQPEERLLRPREAARQLGIGAGTLGEWARAGKIAFTRDPSGYRKYPQAEVSRIRDMLDAAAGPA